MGYLSFHHGWCSWSFVGCFEMHSIHALFDCQWSAVQIYSPCLPVRTNLSRLQLSYLESDYHSFVRSYFLADSFLMQKSHGDHLQNAGTPRMPSSCGGFEDDLYWNSSVHRLGNLNWSPAGGLAQPKQRSPYRHVYWFGRLMRHCELSCRGWISSVRRIP